MEKQTPSNLSMRNTLFSRLIIVAILLLSGYYSFAQKTETQSVYFDFNKSNLNIAEKQKIDNMIKGKTLLKIELQGHCDSVGNHKYNDALAQKRVEEVRKYLIAGNVKSNIIVINSFGKRVPLNKNITESERALNRRVELKITYTPPSPNQKEITIKGTVLNDEQKPVKAEVSLNDESGNEVISTTSDKNGKYEIKTNVDKTRDYLLIFYNDSSFIASQKIKYSENGERYKDIKTVLPELKGGKKYELENLNFIGDTSQLLDKSIPALYALQKLMKKNKSLVIRIEGHVNYPLNYPDPKTNYPTAKKYYVPKGMTTDMFNQWLSDERAKAIFNYLVTHGIDKSRMSTIGHGNSKMLFPYPANNDQMEKNRRVEISVISF